MRATLILDGSGAWLNLGVDLREPRPLFDLQDDEKLIAYAYRGKVRVCTYNQERDVSSSICTAELKDELQLQLFDELVGPKVAELRKNMPLGHDRMRRESVATLTKSETQEILDRICIAAHNDEHLFITKAPWGTAVRNTHGQLIS